MLAEVDDKYRLKYMSCDHAGSSHDATVLKSSSLYKHHGTIIAKGTKEIEGVQVPYFLLVDSAYPLLPWIIKVYQGRNITAEEESFNAYHSRGHVVLENAFGHLKAQFRCLAKQMDIDYKYVPQVVKTCVILHNIIETEKDYFMPNWLEAVENAELLFPRPSKTTSREIDVSLIREVLNVLYIFSIYFINIFYYLSSWLRHVYKRVHSSSKS